MNMMKLERLDTAQWQTLHCSLVKGAIVPHISALKIKVCFVDCGNNVTLSISLVALVARYQDWFCLYLSGR